MAISQKIFYNQKIDDAISDKIHNSIIEISNKLPELNCFSAKQSDENIVNINDIALKINNCFDNLIIIGAGASINIPKILFSLPYRSLLNVIFFELVDYASLSKNFASLNPRRTAILTISKSGRTCEVAFLLDICMKWINKNVEIKKQKNHFYFVTESGSRLGDLASDIGAINIEHPQAVSGRFSFFYSTGLLPAAIAGFDIKKIIENKKIALGKILIPGSWFSEGCIYDFAMRSQHEQSIYIYYDGVFEGLMLWIKQMIAESLGKDAKGVYPIISQGLVDRHSQLQLYLDGPSSSYFNFLNYDNKKENFKTDDLLSESDFHKFNDSQSRAMIETLYQAGKNVKQIITTSLEEDFIAEFMVSQMLGVILSAHLDSINPFDQPAVENFKKNLKQKYVK